MKDYFSQQSKLYAAFRPTYPDALYNFIFSHLKDKQVAWDCGTGNGQVAQKLSTAFSKVYATDISAQQIAEGFKQTISSIPFVRLRKQRSPTINST